MVEKPFGVFLVEARQMLASDHPHYAFPLLYEALSKAPVEESGRVRLMIEELESSCSVWQLVIEAGRVSVSGSEQSGAYSGHGRVEHLLDIAMRGASRQDERDLVRRARIKILRAIAASWQDRSSMDHPRLLYLRALDEAAKLSLPDRALSESIERELVALCGYFMHLFCNREPGADEKLRKAALTLGIKHACYRAAMVGLRDLFTIYGRQHTLAQRVQLLYQELKGAYGSMIEGADLSEFADYLEIFADFSQNMQEHEFALNAYDRAIAYCGRRTIYSHPKEEFRFPVLLLRSARSALKLGLTKDAWFRLAQVRMFMEDSFADIFRRAELQSQQNNPSYESRANFVGPRAKSLVNLILRAESLIRSHDERASRTADKLICVALQFFLQCLHVTTPGWWMAHYHTGTRWHNDPRDDRQRHEVRQAQKRARRRERRRKHENSRVARKF